MNMVDKVARVSGIIFASATFIGVSVNASAKEFSIAWSIPLSGDRGPGLVIDRKAYPSFLACKEEAERRAKLKSAFHASYYCIPQDIKSQAQELMPYDPLAIDH